MQNDTFKECDKMDLIKTSQWVALVNIEVYVQVLIQVVIDEDDKIYRKIEKKLSRIIK